MAVVTSLAFTAFTAEAFALLAFYLGLILGREGLGSGVALESIESSVRLRLPLLLPPPPAPSLHRLNIRAQAKATHKQPGENRF